MPIWVVPEIRVTFLGSLLLFRASHWSGASPPGSLTKLAGGEGEEYLARAGHWWRFLSLLCPWAALDNMVASQGATPLASKKRRSSLDKIWALGFMF